VMLSTANELASRLHQAIILSSQQHQHLLLYYLLPHTQVLYYFRLQNILNSSPRRETRKGKGASAVPRFADLGVTYTDRSLLFRSVLTQEVGDEGCPERATGAADEDGDSLTIPTKKRGQTARAIEIGCGAWCHRTPPTSAAARRWRSDGGHAQ